LFQPKFSGARFLESFLLCPAQKPERSSNCGECRPVGRVTFRTGLGTFVKDDRKVTAFRTEGLETGLKNWIGVTLEKITGCLVIEPENCVVELDTIVRALSVG
jgi:hypothetical protein